MELLESVEFALALVAAVTVALIATVVGLVSRPTDTPDAEPDASVATAPVSTDKPASTDQVDTPDTALTPVDAVVETPEPVDQTPTIDRPEAAKGRLVRLRERLARSNSALGKGLLALLSRDTIDEDTWEEMEDLLLSADLGVEPAMELIDSLRERVKVLGTQSPDELKALLSEELLTMVDESMDREIVSSVPGDRPAVVLVVGVNGAGKTTSVGKLARVLVADDKDVVLGAADTFRAAAADQLQTWGQRVGIPTVRSDQDGADPAAVAFDTIKEGIDAEADVVLIDTAGRLQNKVGLMDELGKIKRVAEKALGNGETIDEVLLVLDATTGQNGLRQAEVFAEAVNVTGVILAKLDGTAKGGIVVAVQRKLGVPVKLVGLGEGPDDLAPFDPKAFVAALVD